jgi:hypothetical protein
MKNTIKTLATLAILGFAGVASAQLTNNATSQASASAVCPITLSESGALAFGSFASPANSTGTVTSANTYSSANYLGGTDPGDATNAGTVSQPCWTATGNPSWYFQITGSSATFNVIDANNATMTVNLPNLPGVGGTPTASAGLSLNSYGHFTWTTTGAILNVNQNQETGHGTYTGSFSYTVNYD